MFRPKESLSVFDIENDIVKLAQFTIDEHRSVLNRLIAARALKNTPDALSRTIQKLANDYKIAATRAIINVPRYKVTVRNLKLPSVNPTEIDSMVNLQAVKQLPFAPDKIVSGYRILGRDAKGYSDIMLALAHADEIARLCGPFNKAGVSIERLSLSSETISLLYLKRLKDQAHMANACLVDIGRSVVDVQLIKSGIIVFSRCISFATEKDMSSKIAGEVKKTLFTYSRTFPGAKVNKLILTGKRSVLKNEAQSLRKELGLQTSYIDVLGECPKGIRPRLPADNDIENETFTSVIASGQALPNLQVNLLPLNIRHKKIAKILRESMIMSAVLAFCIVVGVGGIATKSYLGKLNQMASINRQLTESKPKVEKLTRLKAVTEVVKAQLQTSGSSIDILRELYAKMPSQISLTIFDFEDKRTCLLRGMSKTLSDVYNFISILDDSEYFEKVIVRYATKRLVGNEEITDFEIHCNLSQI